MAIPLRTVRDPYRARKLGIISYSARLDSCISAFYSCVLIPIDGREILRYSYIRDRRTVADQVRQRRPPEPLSPVS